MHDERDYEELTMAVAFAAEVTGRGKRDQSDSLRVQKTCKLYQEPAFLVAALANSSGLSQNEIINQLIVVGVEAIRKEMTDEERSKAFCLNREEWRSQLKGDA